MNYNKLSELYKIAQDNDIGVYFLKMTDELKGYSTYANGCYDIFINNSLSYDDILHSMAHEMWHIQHGIGFAWTSDFQNELYERKAENYAITYIVPYEDVVDVVTDMYIKCEYEAAEKLHLDMNTFMWAVKYYESLGLPVRQCDFITDWRQWDY